MIKCSIYLKNADKIHIDFTNKQFQEIKKHIVKTNFDGSYTLKNGDVIQVYK